MRSFARGSERCEIGVCDRVVSVRRFSNDALVDETASECASPIKAKWDADRLCRDLLADDYERVDHDDVPALTRHELAAALAADPEDLETYLVYADWLSERGDVWGQLIAIQHTLATLPRFGATARRDELERAETVFLFEHGARLWGVLGETIVDDATQKYASDLIEATWRCGFLHAATIRDVEPPLSTSLIHALTSLEIATLLRSLRLDGISGAPEIVAEHVWPHLTALEITGDPIEYREGHAIDANRLVPLITGAICPALTHLTLSETHWTDAVCTALAASPLAARLEVLALFRGQFSAGGIAALRSAHFPSLREVHVTGLGPPTAHRDLAGIAARVHVELRLDGDPEDD